MYMQPFVSDLPDKGWKVEDGYFYGYTGHPIFATALSIPLLLSFVLLIPHWYRTEKTFERNVKKKKMNGEQNIGKHRQSSEDVVSGGCLKVWLFSSGSWPC